MPMPGSVTRAEMVSRDRQSLRYVTRILAGMDDVVLNSTGKSREGLKRGPF
ncbi:hypothetical protein SAMN05421890_3647 [Ensifer adhaerens]|nr:hypothetical protein SAMN05421890_3647 [Ensifer adhaerens]HZG29741.1 hypothetical protein [Ensifer sp.]